MSPFQVGPKTIHNNLLFLRIILLSLFGISLTLINLGELNGTHDETVKNIINVFWSTWYGLSRLTLEIHQKSPSNSNSACLEYENSYYGIFSPITTLDTVTTFDAIFNILANLVWTVQINHCDSSKIEFSMLKISEIAIYGTTILNSGKAIHAISVFWPTWL